MTTMLNLVEKFALGVDNLGVVQGKAYFIELDPGDSTAEEMKKKALLLSSVGKETQEVLRN